MNRFVQAIIVVVLTFSMILVGKGVTYTVCQHKHTVSMKWSTPNLQSFPSKEKGSVEFPHFNKNCMSEIELSVSPSDISHSHHHVFAAIEYEVCLFSTSKGLPPYRESLFQTPADRWEKPPREYLKTLNLLLI